MYATCVEVKTFVKCHYKCMYAVYMYIVQLCIWGVYSLKRVLNTYRRILEVLCDIVGRKLDLALTVDDKQEAIERLATATHSNAWQHMATNVYQTTNAHCIYGSTGRDKQTL